MKKNNLKCYKVFMGMSEVAGYFTRLSDAFEELGIENYFINYRLNKFSYEKKYKTYENFSIRELKKAYIDTLDEKGFVKKIFSKIKFYFYMIVLFIWALFHCNVFIFMCGNSFFTHMRFLDGVDLKLLKLLKKTMIFLYVGSDSRPLYASFAANSNDIENIISGTRMQSEEIRDAEKYATYVIDNPASSHFHHMKFISFFKIGMPINDDEERGAIIRNNKESTVILHAPTNLELKGTERIRDTINSLIKKGYNIEYIELTNTPNDIVREHIDKCDFIIDELYSDCPLAGFSTEAAIKGKPAVIGGYAGDFLKSLYTEEDMPPSIYIDPDNLENTVEEMLINKQLVNETGEKARAYVTDNWDSRIIAEKYLTIFSGAAPESWYYDPYQSDYLFGCGINKDRIKRTVSDINMKYGISALCIDDKSQLLEGYLNLIG